MSNRFHNKFHRHNHHSIPTDRNGMYPDSAYDPIASEESPFQGDFYLKGDFIGLSSLTVYQTISGTRGNFLDLFAQNLTVLGNTTQLDTLVFTTSALEITNAGTGAGLIVTQTGAAPIAEFVDADGGSGIYFDTIGQVGIGTSNPWTQLHIRKTDGGFSDEANTIALLESSYRNSIVRLKAEEAGKIEFNDQDTHQNRASIIGTPSLSSIHFTTSTREALRINYEGNIGIGNANANNELKVRSLISGRYLHIQNDDSGLHNSNAATIVESVSGNSLFVGAIREGTKALFRAIDNTQDITYGQLGITGEGETVFWSTDFSLASPLSSVDSYLQETMRITNGGSVGIGTSTPADTMYLSGQGKALHLHSNFYDGTPKSNVAIIAESEYRNAYLMPVIGPQFYNEGGMVVKRSSDGTTLGKFVFDGVGTACIQNVNTFPSIQILSGGNVGIGINPTTFNGQVQIGNEDVEDEVSNLFISKHTESVLGPNLLLGKSRGSHDIPLLSLNGDNAGTVGFGVYDGNVYRKIAYISSTAETQISAGNVAGSLIFGTTPGGSQGVERMRITQIGNMGINTINPQAKLDVNGDVQCIGFVVGGAEMSTQDAYAKIGSGRIGNGKAHVYLNTTNLGTEYEAKFYRNAGVNGDAGIRNTGIGLLDITQEGNSSILFATDGIERMRILGNGNVGINNNDPAQSLTVGGEISAINTIWSTTYFEVTAGLEPVYGNSIQWNSVYTSNVTTSAYWDSAFSTLSSVSSVYLNVVNNSATYATYDYSNTRFLAQSGGIVSGPVSIGGDTTIIGDNIVVTGLTGVTINGETAVNGNTIVSGKLTIFGDLSSTGTQTFANTVFNTTSALSVVNIGNDQPAVYIANNGSGDIASFYDLDEGIEVLHIGGNNGSNPGVGIKTSTPNTELTVNGQISANNVIWSSAETAVTLISTDEFGNPILDGNSDPITYTGTIVQTGNSQNWTSVYTNTNTYSASWAQAADFHPSNEQTYNAVTSLSAYWTAAADAGQSTAAVFSIVSNLSGPWNSVYNTVYYLSGNWATGGGGGGGGTGLLVANVGYVNANGFRSNIPLSQFNEDQEILQGGTTGTLFITGFTNGIKGITYTLTNKLSSPVTIIGNNKIIIRDGSSWRSNSIATSGLFVTIPLSGSFSLRADSNDVVSIW